MTSNKCGGMYSILPKIIKYLETAEKERFTSKEIHELAKNIDLSKQAIINNITRLVNTGYLVKHEYRRPGLAGKIVEYTISPYVINFVKEVLYDETKI